MNSTGHAADSRVITADESNFDELIKSGNVVVDFWAEWCGPCKMIAPALDNLSKKYDGKVKFIKVNVDENQNLAMRYGIMSIPNLNYFKNGEKVASIPGAMPEFALDQYVKQMFELDK